MCSLAHVSKAWTVASVPKLDIRTKGVWSGHVGPEDMPEILKRHARATPIMRRWRPIPAMRESKTILSKVRVIDRVNRC